MATDILDLILPFFGHKVKGIYQSSCTRCQPCHHEIWYCRTEQLPVGSSKAILQSQGIDFSIRIALYVDNLIVGYLDIAWDKMPRKGPDNSKTMCDAAEVLTYLLSKEGLERIQSESR
jgi:hypothetical protein